MLTVKLSNLKMIIIIQMNRRFDHTTKPLCEQTSMANHLYGFSHNLTNKKWCNDI